MNQASTVTVTCKRRDAPSSHSADKPSVIIGSIPQLQVKLVRAVMGPLQALLPGQASVQSVAACQNRTCVGVETKGVQKKMEMKVREVGHNLSGFGKCAGVGRERTEACRVLTATVSEQRLSCGHANRKARRRKRLPAAREHGSTSMESSCKDTMNVRCVWSERGRNTVSMAWQSTHGKQNHRYSNCCTYNERCECPSNVLPCTRVMVLPCT